MVHWSCLTGVEHAICHGFTPNHTPYILNCHHGFLNELHISTDGVIIWYSLHGQTVFQEIGGVIADDINIFDRRRFPLAFLGDFPTPDSLRKWQIYGFTVDIDIASIQPNLTTVTDLLLGTMSLFLVPTPRNSRQLWQLQLGVSFSLYPWFTDLSECSTADSTLTSPACKKSLLYF